MEWISVMDKQPPIWKYVRVTNTFVRQEFIAYRSLFGFWKYKSGFTGNIIVASDCWQPLPKSPKKKSD